MGESDSAQRLRLSTIRSNLDFQREGAIPRPEATEARPGGGAVLGRDVMEAVWEDMKLTELPSWMSPAPPNWGATSWGKLTADQWMVVCTVHLPVTLTRLWGSLNDRRFNLLCNFMDLISAVQLATQRSITPQMIEDHERLMARYLTEMKTLFKGSTVRPIHHVALHTGDFLRLFGPTHAVQAFGGERFLEILGMQNVNNKSGTFIQSLSRCVPHSSIGVGELEATFTRAVCRSSNLQGILSDTGLPSEVKPLLDTFHRFANEDHRGTRLADETHHPPTKPPKLVELAQDVRAAITHFLNRKYRTNKYTTDTGRWSIPQTALSLDKISIRGVIYASGEALRRDSNVIFRRVGGSSDRPGQIDSILSLQHITPGTDDPTVTSTLLVVQEWGVVEDEDAQRRYRQFGFAGGFLCWNRITNVHLVEVDNIVSHHARTFFGQQDSDSFHVLPLNKVHTSGFVSIPRTILTFT